MFDTATAILNLAILLYWTSPHYSGFESQQWGATDGVKLRELFIKPRATHYRCITSVSLGDFRALGHGFRAGFMGLCTREAGQL